MARTRIIAALAGALCACASVLSAPAGSAERYPVWWAPEIGIESLDEIDALLAKPFPPELRHTLYTYVWQGRQIPSGKGFQPKDPQPIDNCLTLFQWLAAKYETHVYDWDGFQAYRRAYAYCYALRALKRARPAKISYVRDFVMDAHALDYLPALVGPWWSCRLYTEVVEANRGGVPWGRFDFESGSVGGVHRVAVAENHNVLVLQAWSSGDRRPYLVVEIIGRGDFNGDGLDDLLLRMTSMGYSPDTRESEYFLVSRRRGDKVLCGAEVLSPLHDRGRCAPGPDELWEPR